MILRSLILCLESEFHICAIVTMSSPDMPITAEGKIKVADCFFYQKDDFTVPNESWLNKAGII
jgi:hypothetical protein